MSKSVRDLIKPVREWIRAETVGRSQDSGSGDDNGGNLPREVRVEPHRFLRLLASRRKPSAKETFPRVPGPRLGVSYLQERGFNQPILVEEDLDETGLNVNGDLANIDTIVNILGGETIVEVINTHTQMTESWALGTFSTYWKSPPDSRDKCMNIISLQVAKSGLGGMITIPKLVREIDWAQTLQRKESLVCKYILMSAASSYTNFHTDFGGSSVWFYVVKGHKVFYLTEPTSENLSKYEEWRNGDNDNTFFGDVVEVCYELHLREGQLLLMPGGWIHAVFTTTDTVSVSGNFLHNFNIVNQLSIQAMEVKNREPAAFRFPGSSTLNLLAAERFGKGLEAKITLSPFEQEGVRALLDHLIATARSTRGAELWKKYKDLITRT